MPPLNDEDLQDRGSSVLGRSFSAIRWRRSSAPKKAHSELATAALGITLGLICALFPWYVFLNPDQFGIRQLKFSGHDMVASGPTALRSFPDKLGIPMTVEIPKLPLDPFATGGLAFFGSNDLPEPVSAAEQPFPVEKTPFRVVHATLGRAMIEDDSGLFIVQAGSILPDSSKVKAIEQRKGEWVLLTNEDKLLTVEP